MTTVPVDILIDENGVIEKAYYWKNTTDHLSFKEVLDFSSKQPFKKIAFHKFLYERLLVVISYRFLVPLRHSLPREQSSLLLEGQHTLHPLNH